MVKCSPFQKNPKSVGAMVERYSFVSNLSLLPYNYGINSVTLYK